MSAYSDEVNIKPVYSNQGVTSLFQGGFAPSEKAGNRESGPAYTVSISKEARGLEAEYSHRKDVIETDYNRDRQDLKARYNSEMRKLDSQYAQEKKQLLSPTTA